MRVPVKIGVAVVASLTAAAVLSPGVGSTVPHQRLGSNVHTDLTAGQAVEIVRTIMESGLDCAYPGSGLAPVGYKAKSRGGGGFTVTVTVSGKDRAGTVVSFGIGFDVLSAADVKPTSLAAQEILACSGWRPGLSCATKKTGLRKQPLGGKPYARYGPITVYRRVPGLKIVKRGGRWELSGIRAAGLGDLWVMDDCTGNGRIVSGSKSVVAGGQLAARVGDSVIGDESTECPSSPLHVAGKILTGDPRIAIDGRPLAVPGSRVVYVPTCGSGAGHVGS